MTGLEYENKHVVVSGGGSGIGRALALAFAREGATVTISDIDAGSIATVVAELQQLGIEARGFEVDHCDEVATAAFCSQLLEQAGPVDVVCANAGIGDSSTLVTGDMARWRKVMDLNVMGVAYLLHYLVPSMIDNGGGKILITASGAGLVPGPGMSIYHASKAAAVSLGSSLACELESHNIGVSVICPGVINTNIIEDCSFNVGSEEENARAAKDAADLYKSSKAVDPSVVAADALRGLRRNKLIIPTPWSHVGPGYLLQRLSPGWLNRFVAIPAWRKGETIGGVKVRQDQST